MTVLTITDLAVSRDLDRQAMASITGAGAGWLFGWIRAYVPEARRFGQAVNVYQTNNFFIADQINNQIALIDIDNSAAGAVIQVDATQLALNAKQ